MTVALYLRISKDPYQLVAGVNRQRTDCANIALHRWPDEPTAEYVDNDISASRYSKRSRPAYAKLLNDIETREVTALVGWNFDRLFRQPRELEAFLDLADRVALTRVVTAQGDIDLTSHDGRLHARIMVAVAAKESDDKSRRVRRASQDRREAGQHHGGKIVYGYRMIERTPVVVPEQAEIVREVAARVLSGESFQAIARDLRERHPDAPGSGTGLRSMLLSPTLVGRNSAGVAGTWTPILDEQTQAELRAMLTAPERAKVAPSGERRWWLSGLVVCAECDGNMVVSTNGGRMKHGDTARLYSYRCDRVNDRGCGKVSVRALALHRHVAIAIQEAAEFRRAVDPAPVVRVDDERLAELAGLYAAGDITRGEWVAARDAVQERGRVSPAASVPVSRPVAWESIQTVAERHVVAASLIEQVQVSPAAKRGVWEPERIRVRWMR